MGPVDGIYGAGGGNRLIEVCDDETAHPVLDDFRHGTLAVGDDRRAAGHGLDHDQTERLRPIDGEEKGSGIAEKIVLVHFVYFADKIDQRLLQERLDPRVEILFIDWIYLRRDLEFHAEGQGNGDGLLHPLLRRDPAKEGEIAARLRMEGQQLLGDAVVDRGLPVGVRQWPPLRVGDGNDRHVGKFGVEELQVVDVLSAVQGGELGRG